MKFVDPKTSIAFKKIFRDNKTILIELVNTVLELENPINYTIIIEDVHPYYNPEMAALEDIVLAVSAYSQKGYEFMVVIQIARACYWNQKELDVYEYQEIQAHKLKNIIETSRQEGKVEGERNKQVEIAKNFLKANMEKDFIAQVTGLSVEGIEQLKGEN